MLWMTQARFAKILSRLRRSGDSSFLKISRKALQNFEHLLQHFSPRFLLEELSFYSKLELLFIEKNYE